MKKDKKLSRINSFIDGLSAGKLDEGQSSFLISTGGVATNDNCTTNDKCSTNNEKCPTNKSSCDTNICTSNTCLYINKNTCNYSSCS